MRPLTGAFLLVLTLIPIGPISTPSVMAAPRPISIAQTSSCGVEAPAGLVLYHAFDADGRLADPPLVAEDPTNRVRRPLQIPDPRTVYPTQIGCRAVVKTATGEFYVVEGSTGETYLLDFLDPADEWQYEWYDWVENGQRFGLFQTKESQGRQAIVLDFDMGIYWNLTPIITDKGTFTSAEFSASGKYLTFNAGPLLEERLWLVPMEHPDQARPAKSRIASFIAFDPAEKQMLYLSFDQNDQELILEDIATGETSVIATDPSEKEEYDPYLSGWFLPGHDDQIAVLHADRFALVDISGPDPTEQFVLDGHRPFAQFIAGPSGTGGVLYGQGSMTYIDFELSESREITTNEGEPVSLAASADRWILTNTGDTNLPPTERGIVDLNTGTYRALEALPSGVETDWGASRVSEDGRILLLTTNDETGRQHLFLVNSETLTVRALAESSSIDATLSGDAAWAAYSTSESTGDGLSTLITVVRVEDGTAIDLGPGLDPVWLVP